MTIRFHLDESMPSAVAEGLARRGLDVTMSAAVGLIAADDPTQLAFAAAENRVLVTRDQDFLRLNSAGVRHTGIVYWTQRRRTLGQLVRALDLLAMDRSADDLSGQVIYLQLVGPTL